MCKWKISTEKGRPFLGRINKAHGTVLERRIDGMLVSDEVQKTTINISPHYTTKSQPWTSLFELESDNILWRVEESFTQKYW